MIPFLRFHRAPFGTVYLMQSRGEPDLFKVGFTTRKTITRRAELNRVAGDDMRIVSTVSMPWARECESVTLRRLRRSWLRKRDRRGTEWFRLRRGESIEQITSHIEAAARRVELVARLKLSWPRETRIRHFHAHRPTPAQPQEAIQSET